ncbi:Hypothetical predicted protein [Paramuricea clavata]|uniref:Uncharacterized protein n=1 Tax=Paramuricea clavata TaxID=317549 RepID=A0A6S7FWS0_PARCT|nr:Hypothetical predicted protein [Paramuricea clavata]
MSDNNIIDTSSVEDQSTAESTCETSVSASARKINLGNKEMPELNKSEQWRGFTMNMPPPVNPKAFDYNKAILHAVKYVAEETMNDAVQEIHNLNSAEVDEDRILKHLFLAMICDEGGRGMVCYFHGNRQSSLH